MGLRGIIGWAFTIVGSLYGQGWAVAVGQGMMARDGYLEAKKARRRALQAYNDSVKDRLEMVDLQPDAARTLVLGRVRCVEGVRRRWTSGTNDETLTMIVSFAGHEIDAFEQWYVDDMPVTLDGSGWVQEAPYSKTTDNDMPSNVSTTLDGSGGAVVVLSATPVSGTVAAWWYEGFGESQSQGPLTVGVVGTTVTLSGGPAGATATVYYLLTSTARYLRIRPYLGTAAQNVGSALAAEYPGKITATDKFAGIALAVVDVVYNPDVFPQGRPNITCVIRGAKCLDPRTSTTAWTQNPALHALHYATWAHGWALTAGDYLAADINAAANVCDVSTAFPVRGTDDIVVDVTLPRYRCGITIKADADHAASMDAIIETMAGRHGWAGGVWRLRAGTLGSTVATITQDWLVNNHASGRPDDEPVISAAQSVPREQRINRVTGSCVDPDQRHQLLPFPAVEDAVLVAAEGERPAEVEFSGVDHIAHAQHLASMAIRQAQAGLQVELTCDERAQTLELFDVVELTMARYGFSAKKFEVTGWTWNQAGAYKVRLAEITAALFTVEAELTGRDPAPDSDLRPPWSVEAITGLAVDSGTTALTDGSILTRTIVTWDAVVGESVRNGGSIEVQYTPATEALPDGDWPSWVEQGSAVQTVIPGLMAGRYYLFRARAVQGQPLVRGPWCAPVAHQVADVPVIAGASILELQATGFAFVFDDVAATTSDSPTISFEAVLHNVAGTATFTATAFNAAGTSLGTITLGGSGNTRTLTAAQFNNSGAWATQYVTVLAELGALSDRTTVYRGDGGSSAVQAMLTNEAHTLPTTSAGVVTYTGSGTGIRVFEGVTELDYVAAAPGNGQWTATRATTSGTVTPGAITESGLQAVMAAHSAMTTDAAQVTVTITGKTSTGAAFSLTKIQSLAKSLQGATGETGGAGESWSAVAVPGAITRTKGGTFSPNSCYFYIYKHTTTTALATAYFSFYKGTGTTSYTWGTSIDGSGSSYLGQSDLGVSLNSTHTALKFEVYEDSGRTILLDTLIVPIVQEGADAITAVLSNAAHTLPAANDGTVSSYTGSGTTIQVYEGSTLLQFNTVIANSRFTVGTPTVAPAASITVGALSGSGTTTCTVAVHSGASAAQDVISITYPLTVRRANGVDVTVNLVQTLTKSKAGSTGNTGQSNHRVYKAVTIGSPPATPGNTTSGATPATWSATPLTLSTGQEQYQSDGTTAAGSTTTVWGTPYPSYLKVGSLSAISADLGTVTAGSVSTSGYLKAEGTTTLTVGDLGSRTVAIAGNTSYGADVGVFGAANGINDVGVYGYSVYSGSGSGVYGYGYIGVSGATSQASGFGIIGYTHPTSASTAIRANVVNAASGSVALDAIANNAGQTAVLATSAGGTALRVSGALRIDQTPDSTTGGGALTVANLPTGTTAKTLKWIEVNLNGTAHWVACVAK